MKVRVAMQDIRCVLRKGISELEAYVPGKSLEEVQAELGLTQIAGMAFNENPCGPSPKALAAIERELKNVHLYPEGPCTGLRRKMSHQLGIDEDMITISNGADNAILLVGSAFISEGEEIIMADPTFSVYKTVSKIMGGRPISVKAKNHVHDLEGMRKRIGERTKLVFVCNPNNPTGTIVDTHELDRFLSQIPEKVVVVLDEAYIEFVSEPGYPTGIDYAKQGYNVVSLRTFSKLYGLAGMRVGYAVGRSDLIGALNKVREPFPVSRLAQAAALGALDDEAFRERVLIHNREAKAYLCKEFERMGLSYVPSHTNFVFVDLKRDSREVSQSLLKEGIIIRPGHLWDFPNFARVTVGPMEDNRRFISALKRIL